MMTYILIYIVCGAFWGLYFSLHKDNEDLLNERSNKYRNDSNRELKMRLLTGWMFAVYALTWPLWIVLGVIDIVLNVTNKVLKITK